MSSSLLTQETFEPLVGETFSATAGEHSFELELKEVTASGGTPRKERAPFSAVFEAPPGVLIPQQIVSLDHENLGPIDLFLVPLDSDDKGVLYEAVMT